MLKSAIKSLLAHKTRLALSTLAVVLGVAFIAGTYIYTDTTNEAFGGIFDDAYVGIDVIVTNDSEFSFGQGVFFDDELRRRHRRRRRRRQQVEPAVDGFGAQILDNEGDGDRRRRSAPVLGLPARGDRLCRRFRDPRRPKPDGSQRSRHRRQQRRRGRVTSSATR